MDKKLYVTIGAPGAGKSTWCLNNINKLFSWIISRDRFRIMLGIMKDYEKTIGNTSQEDEVTKLVDGSIDAAMKCNLNIAIDATNINIKTRKYLCDKAKSFGYEIIYVVFQTPIEVCKERRKDQMDDTIDYFFAKMLDEKHKIREDEYNEIIYV